MANPHPVGNMNLADAPKPSATTEIGKYFRDLPKYSRNKIPYELLDLYDWCKGLSTKKVDYLLELKNMYQVLKGGILKRLLDKMESGKDMSQTEINQFRLAVDIMEKSHKLKYGDKKVIEKIVTYEDVRRQIFSDKKIIDVEDISKNADRRDN